MKIRISVFEKWWLYFSLFVLLVFANVFFDHKWFFYTLIIITGINIYYNLYYRRWKYALFSAGLLISFFILVIVLYIKSIVNPNVDDINNTLADLYEKREKIQTIIGIKIPEYKIIESRVLNHRNYDFEINVECNIEFKELPKPPFYRSLDSICGLTVPDSFDVASPFFYNGLEQIHSCWSKKNGKYRYNRNGDFGGKYLHSTDAYFELQIDSGSRFGVIKYGNY